MKKILFAAVVCLIAVIACEQVQNPIPGWMDVNLTINLDMQDSDLVPPYSYKEFYPAPGKPVSERYGFGGLLIVHGPHVVNNSEIFAYDRACPYEALMDVRVKMVETDLGLHAECPECGSVYDVMNGLGNPVSGISKYYLRQYKVVPTRGNQFLIYN